MTRSVRSVALLASIAAAIASHAAGASAQSAAKRDSMVADSLTRLKPYMNGWRLTTLNRAITTLRTPVVTPTPVPVPVNQPPVASLRVACDTLRKCVATSTSTDDVGIVSYAWSWGDGNTSTATQSASHTYAAAGTYTVSLTVKDSGGLSATASASAVASSPAPTPTPPPDSTPAPTPTPVDTATHVGLAEKPRVTPTLVPTLPTRSYVIGANVQQALDTAKAGDELRLKPGLYVASLRWPQVCAMGKWLTLRTDLTNTAPYATLADSLRFARIVTNTSSWALRVDGPVCNVQLKDLAFQVTDAPSINYGVVWLGNGGWVAGGEMQTTLSSVPQNILLDHVLVYGTTNANTTRCLALNSGVTVVVHSWFSGCHADGFDAQAIATWNGPGGWLIEDNYIEASGENFIAGGADAGIPGLIPCDITFRRNHFYKPVAWKGTRWEVKNLFELKNACRVMVEANVFQHSWPAAQEGWAFILASINQGGTTAGSYATVKDVIVRWNTVDDANHAIAVAPANNYAGAGATPAKNISVVGNRWTNIAQKMFLVNGGMSGVTFSGNTSGPANTFFQIGSQSTADRFPSLSVTNNRAGPATYALNSPGGDNAAMFAAYGIPLSSFAGNCIARPTTDYLLNATALPGNTFVTDQSACPAAAGVDPAFLAAKVAGVQRTVPVARKPSAVRRPLAAPRDAVERGRRARQVVGSGGLVTPPSR